MNIKNNIINLGILLLFLFDTDLAIIFEIPYLRLVLGFILLTIIPGLLIVNLLHFRDMGFVKKILYSVGISISLLMIMGFLINLIGPIMGFLKPISFYPILFSINCGVIFLAGLSYYKHTLDFSLTDLLQKYIRQIVTIPSFCLFLVLILGILGGLVIRNYLSSLFWVILILGIGILVTLIAYEKIIPPAYYPYTLFVISLSVLLTHTLTSPYLFGSDIHAELFFQRLTELNAYWDPSILPNNVNAMLSTVMLPTIYSIILQMDTIWIYKIIFPIIFSLVPVIMYNIFNRQIGNKFAFLSVFFFMSFYAYSTTLLWLPRQQIAELFLALFLLTLLDKQLDNFNKHLLLTLWTISIVVSHYATTYIFLVFLLGVYLFIKICSVRDSPINVKVILFFGIFALSWYIFISESTPFKSILDIGENISLTIINEAFSRNSIDPSIDSALGSGMFSLPFWHTLGRLWQIGTQFFIILGFICLILKYKSTKFDIVFIFFSLMGILFLIVSMTVPFFASSLNMDRIYHIILIFISPLCIFGLLAFIRIFAKIFRLDILKTPVVVSTLMVVLLVPYFLFSTGAIFEITENSENFNFDLTPATDFSFDHFFSGTYSITTPIIPAKDVVANEWISKYSETESSVYSDTDRACEIYGYGSKNPDLVEKTGYFPESGGYVFIGFINYANHQYLQQDINRVHSVSKVPMDTILMKLKDRNFIFNNGAGIYY
jgi:uncharacterized membrane protein